MAASTRHGASCAIFCQKPSSNMVRISMAKSASHTSQMAAMAA
ncbi:hypothetical protein [Kingella denitrificans]